MKGIISARDFLNNVTFDDMMGRKKPVKKYTKKQIRHFNKLGAAGIIDKIVLKEMDKNEIIYGAKATNKQIPETYMRRFTEDFDILSLVNPQKSARDVEKALDKKFGGDYFYTKKGKHPNTWKVLSHEGIGASRPVADFTRPSVGAEVSERERKTSKKIIYNKINGINYVSKSWLLMQSRSLLKSNDPDVVWRHPKEMSKVNRLTASSSVKRKTHVYHTPKNQIDTDGDGVIDKLDCQPLNPLKQDAGWFKCPRCDYKWPLWAVDPLHKMQPPYRYMHCPKCQYVQRTSGDEPIVSVGGPTAKIDKSKYRK